ncbi:hypothetical protein BJV85_002052 [Clostridium acetobutylicum]|uniref:Uncharacterized protein n=1 Tax=Clostridium acetobutylicum (strain ATCC 824 / DSM 792 / JCM 1419 / IAM 19013 / LMG 5710 / NBRC 13948 / NRRL B-527 / VKM B-1787 / 2291 / W) TaxID=272562 RepID=Q97HR8_CLOAB|nr:MULTISPECIES: hypothetical protein [Clostridium]AAK79902.1 Hypothetical protein CA_C1940 [Clostridium acetobutylicum ATCC 824]ADZ20992.1 Conserved hypothetical protein [Clostridium acetobutylicum EA 2018]AEI32078.1 hypothetical protein SMB_G1969 [Clostridium acetobutylicum DSM 1731]AWV79666.1 hypothetical protein DK921_06045 [Clostridium acetobutylicum]MBC2394358.1 hypothetical protein [Clostridium acetobutylicum]
MTSKEEDDLVLSLLEKIQVKVKHKQITSKEARLYFMGYLDAIERLGYMTADEKVKYHRRVWEIIYTD